MKTHVRTRVILVTALVALLALPVAVHAQETDPVTVVEKQVDAVNKGDAAAAGETMAEDAVVTVPQATSGEVEAEGEGDPAAQAQYSGTAETTAWLEGQAAAGAETTLGECTVEGELVTCDASYTSEALNAKGVGALEGELEVMVVEGKIQSYDFIPSAEAVAMLQAAGAAPETLPTTGGTTQATTYLVLAVLGLLLLLAGTVTRAFRRGV